MIENKLLLKALFRSLGSSLGLAFALTPAVSLAGVVSSPTNGSTMSSPFSLVASQTTCEGQNVASMGYSIDGGSTTIINGTSMNTNVSASTGSHVLHVKSWGPYQASCDTDVNITVSAAPATGVTVSEPANNSDVSLNFALEATSVTCEGQSVVSMGYSLDGGQTTTSSGQSLNTSLTASPGVHTLHVKSWGTGSASCDTDINITAAGSQPSPTPSPSPPNNAGGPSIPSSATVSADIEQESAWNCTNNSGSCTHDKGTSGAAKGSSSLTSSITRNGKEVRKFTDTFSGSGGEIYHDTFAHNATASNFVYENYVWISSSSAGKLGNLEMDMNQVTANGDTIIYGFQCDGYSGTWDYTENAGTAAKPKDHWLHSKQPCNPANWKRDTWNHIQVSYSRNSSGDVIYGTVWLNGEAFPINETVYSQFALGWGAADLLTNFQLDGDGSGSLEVFMSGTTISYW